MLNKVILQGRLTAYPEMKQGASGNTFAAFTLAVDRGKDKETDFINCLAFRQTADFIAQYFGKGDMMLAEGRLNTRKWETQDGKKRVDVSVMVDHVEFCGRKKAEAEPETVPDGVDPADIPLADDDLPF